MRSFKAFSLLEAVLVLVLLGVLAGLAVSMGPRLFDKADLHKAKETLRALELSQLTNSQNRGYLMDAVELSQAEEDLVYTSGAAADGEVSVELSSDGSAVGMAMLKGEACALIKVWEAGVREPTATAVTTGSCSGAAALSIEGEAW